MTTRGGFAAHLESLQQLRVRADRRTASHPIGFVRSRDHENDTDLRVDEQVLHPVDAVVARPVGDQQCAVVEELNEARRIALGRTVDAGPIRAGEHQERRCRDEGAPDLGNVVGFSVTGGGSLEYPLLNESCQHRNCDVGRTTPFKRFRVSENSRNVSYCPDLEPLLMG